MAITEKRDRPIGVLIASDSHHELRLIDLTLDTCFASETLSILVEGKIYRSDPLNTSF